jgi:hypothetical protein
MKKNDEKKVALKLINQYADRYNRVEEENKMLKTEIIDLKTNLKINKEIIEGFFKNDGNLSNLENLFIQKCKEEIKLLNKRNEQVINEREQYKSKVVYYEKIINDSLLEYRDSTETLNNKIFILENAISKKDSLIISLNKKLNNFYDNFENDGNEVDKEIYVSS